MMFDSDQVQAGRRRRGDAATDPDPSWQTQYWRTQHGQTPQWNILGYSESERKQINFTIVPEEAPGPRTYSNFCAIAHTPFDFTLTFCEVMPLSEKELRARPRASTSSALPRARIVVPVQFVPNLISALQEHMRVFRDLLQCGWSKGLVHRIPVIQNSEFRIQTRRATVRQVRLRSAHTPLLRTRRCLNSAFRILRS